MTESAAPMSYNEVGPHEFRPLRRFFNRGRCLHCFVHQHAHPVGWTPSRPWRDKSLPGSATAILGGRRGR